MSKATIVGLILIAANAIVLVFNFLLLLRLRGLLKQGGRLYRLDPKDPVTFPLRPIPLKRPGSGLRES